jgi:hypothetical protein
MYTQVLTYFFSASDIMEAVRGRFRFFGTYYVTNVYYESSMV